MGSAHLPTLISRGSWKEKRGRGKERERESERDVQIRVNINILRTSDYNTEDLDVAES
jgi:hypothetical protein